jgi:hypothetical protein
MPRILRTYIVLILIALLQTAHSNGQVLQNAQAMEQIRKGVNHIYNCEFEQAQAIARYLVNKYPDHSVSYLFRGLIIYWQYFPIIPGSQASQQFEKTLQKGLEIAEQRLKAKKSDPENLLSAIGNAGLLLLFYADNGLSGKVISMAPKTYQWVMSSFDFTHSFKDFYFVTGLYNYYREAYADAHPIYRPIMAFFPHGDKNLGLKQLRIASDSAIFLKAEAVNFLSGIYQSFEHDPAHAILYSRKLRDAFLQNPQFKAGYIRDLLVIRNYGEAESLVKSIPYSSLNAYHQAQADIFTGIIQEKRHKNMKAAETLYWSGINKIEAYGEFGREFCAYAYFGLSRIYHKAGNARASRQYRKQARDLSDYDHVNFDQ